MEQPEDHNYQDFPVQGPTFLRHPRILLYYYYDFYCEEMREGQHVSLLVEVMGSPFSDYNIHDIAPQSLFM